MEKIILGQNLSFTEDGYMTDFSAWTEDIAKELAKEENIELTDKHMEVLKFLRQKHESGDTLSIRSVGKSGIVDIKELYQLFPGGPLKISSKLAGIPKPTSCV
jgi:dissimilatory sulfite reductase related protein